MRLYLASPFFNPEEIINVELAEKILRKAGHDVFSPREHEVRDEETGTPAWAEKIFAGDKEGIDNAEAVVLLYYGNYSDSGTAWECGYAYATGKPVIVVHIKPSTDSNLMVHVGSHSNVMGLAGLMDYDFAAMPKHVYTGAMT